jgi:anti-sigma-K factor RskA
MIEVQSNEDAALRYVLGELSDTERRNFESLMATSAELRTLVNELEAGAIVTATAAPRRRPPTEVWQRIEKAVATKPPFKLGVSAFRFGWLRNGWAMVVVCLIGWLFYAFLAHQHYAAVLAKLKIQQPEITIVNPTEPPSKPVAVKSLATAVTNVAFELLQARTREIIELRGKIAQLETATTQLSRSLAQQNALLGESNRIKFYHLSPASTANANASTAPLSPGLQRAVFMALARELGWLPANPPSATQAGGNVPPMPTTVGGVDFIDLRPASQNVVSQPQIQTQNGSGQPTADNNTTAATQVQPPAQPQTESPAASPTPIASNPTIPAFVSGDNLVVALDSTVAPLGSSVSLIATDANQNQTGGSFILGSNPTVVTIPFSYLSDLSTTAYTTGGYTAGGLYFVTMSFQTPDGQTSTTQFYAPATNP